MAAIFGIDSVKSVEVNGAPVKIARHGKGETRFTVPRGVNRSKRAVVKVVAEDRTEEFEVDVARRKIALFVQPQYGTGEVLTGGEARRGGSVTLRVNGLLESDRPEVEMNGRAMQVTKVAACNELETCITAEISMDLPDIERVTVTVRADGAVTQAGAYLKLIP